MRSLLLALRRLITACAVVIAAAGLAGATAEGLFADDHAPPAAGESGDLAESVAAGSPCDSVRPPAAFPLVPPTRVTGHLLHPPRVGGCPGGTGLAARPDRVRAIGLVLRL